MGWKSSQRVGGKFNTFDDLAHCSLPSPVRYIGDKAGVCTE